MFEDNPRWTVLYNIVAEGSDYVGTGWEFFDDEELAMKKYDALIAQGHCPCKRPFHEECDRNHMGAAHRRPLDVRKD